MASYGPHNGAKGGGSPFSGEKVGTMTRAAAAVEQAKLDAEAARLRSQGYTLPEIAERMECAVQTASNRVRRAIAAVPVEAVTQLRQTQLHRYDFQRRVALRLLAEDHPLIQNGRVIMVEKEQRNADGSPTGRMVNEPVSDVTVKFRALTELRKIEDSIAELCGTAAPKRVDINVITEDAVDAEIKRLERELGPSSGGGAGEQAALSPGVAAPES